VNVKNSCNISWKRTFESKANIGMEVINERKEIIGVIYDISDEFVFAKIHSCYLGMFLPTYQSLSFEVDTGTDTTHKLV
jgi:hypothetical protein